jgi:hypothetical protein
MSRVIRTIVLGVFVIVPGCTTYAPPEPQARRTAIKIVRQTCTITTKPPYNACAKKTCVEIKTCAEVYYRYTVCGDTELDGGRMFDSKPRWEPNGVPCKDKCENALNMAREIREHPYTVPTTQEKVCTPT